MTEKKDTTQTVQITFTCDGGSLYEEARERFPDCSDKRMMERQFMSDLYVVDETFELGIMVQRFIHHKKDGGMTVEAVAVTDDVERLIDRIQAEMYDEYGMTGNFSVKVLQGGQIGTGADLLPNGNVAFDSLLSAIKSVEAAAANLSTYLEILQPGVGGSSLDDKVRLGYELHGLFQRWERLRRSQEGVSDV